MEIEAHKARFGQLVEDFEDLERERYFLIESYGNHWSTMFRPEVIANSLAYTPLIGRAAVELVSLIPHAAKHELPAQTELKN